MGYNSWVPSVSDERRITPSKRLNHPSNNIALPLGETSLLSNTVLRTSVSRKVTRSKMAALGVSYWRTWRSLVSHITSQYNCVMPSGQLLDSHYSDPDRYYILRNRDDAVILVSAFTIPDGAATRQFDICGRLLTTASVSIRLVP